MDPRAQMAICIEVLMYEELDDQLIRILDDGSPHPWEKYFKECRYFIVGPYKFTPDMYNPVLDSIVRCQFSEVNYDYE